MKFADRDKPKGITPSGSIFFVPKTHDVIKALIDPRIKKSNFELFIIILLASNILIFLLAKENVKRINIFIGLYLFWRFSYNLGIGYLLHKQSNGNSLVNWVKKYEIFDIDNNTFISNLIKSEIKSQMGSKYQIEDYPIEFNIWLIFRKVVDLILTMDFFTFIGIVISCSINDNYQFIRFQSKFLIIARLTIGISLIVFNLWVKVNAHKIIKDYAWYWGDFFFQQVNNEKLIFDGVFEMFPHPMYSAGYIGYYGLALISKSYIVMIIALFGHFLQMVFLHFIENPHIEKIYGLSGNALDIIKLSKLKELKYFDNLEPLIGLLNFNWLRASDLNNLILVCTFGFLIPYIASFATNDSIIINFMFFLTIFIKLFETIFINVLLIAQSHHKIITLWYLKNDISVEKSLNNWAVQYNTLINLTYSSFIGLNVYHSLSGNFHLFNFDWVYLRCFFGVVLIITQICINVSIIDSIGYFGWFYGDFFITNTQKNLTKAGVYRYLNDPEYIFGICGVIGITLIIPSLENLICCLLWVINNFVRINFIEKSHKIKIYGEQEVLKDSGVVKTFKNHLMPDMIQRKLNEVKSPKRKLNEGDIKSLNTLIELLNNVAVDLKLSDMKEMIKLMKISQNFTYDNSDYKVNIKTKNIRLGFPIEVEWEAPVDHSETDWIGFYKIFFSCISHKKTLISSFGRWNWCKSNKGSTVFEGDKLFWEEGFYELRYHIDGGHDIVYKTEPFEIKADKIEITEDAELLATQLKDKIFDNIISFDSIDDPIIEIVSKSNNTIKTFERLNLVISASTGIEFDYKFFLDNQLTIKKLSEKLIQMDRSLNDLCFKEHGVTVEKKTL